jgi:alpha-galactosidase
MLSHQVRSCAQNGDDSHVKQGKLPALGLNSWNAFGCNVDAGKIMAAANQVVNLGLKDVGYEYINSK